MIKKILQGLLALILVAVAVIGYLTVDALGVFTAGNDCQYDLSTIETVEGSELEGKTDGMAAGGVSFVYYIAQKDSINFIKEAVSGTTLVDNNGVEIICFKNENN